LALLFMLLCLQASLPIWRRLDRPPKTWMTGSLKSSLA
jgi:hypothetical protein